MRSNPRNYPHWIAIALVVLYVGAGGAAKLGIGIIMVGATYYHSAYTPVFQAGPAFVILMLCAYIFWTTRAAGTAA